MKCHICSYPNEQASFCALCGTDLANPNTETKHLESIHGALYSTVEKTMVAGWDAFIYLTNKRLIIVPAKLKGSGLDGMLAAAIYNKMTSKAGVISIPFEHIKAVRDGKMGLLFKAIVVDTTDGEVVKIKVSKRDEWKAALASATGQAYNII